MEYKELDLSDYTKEKLYPDVELLACAILLSKWSYTQKNSITLTPKAHKFIEQMIDCGALKDRQMLFRLFANTMHTMHEEKAWKLVDFSKADIDEIVQCLEDISAGREGGGP